MGPHRPVAGGWKIRGIEGLKEKSKGKSMTGLILPQRLAATLFGLIYFIFFHFRCRYRAERLANGAGQDVENPWTKLAYVARLFPCKSSSFSAVHKSVLTMRMPVSYANGLGKFRQLELCNMPGDQPGQVARPSICTGPSWMLRTAWLSITSTAMDSITGAKTFGSSLTGKTCGIGEARRMVLVGV